MTAFEVSKLAYSVSLKRLWRVLPIALLFPIAAAATPVKVINGNLYVGWFDTTSELVLAAGTDGTVLRSRDSGLTWAHTPVPTRSVIQRLVGSPGRNSVLFALTDDELFRSTNQGERWDKLAVPDAAPIAAMVDAGTTLNASRNIWIAVSTGGKIWHTDDRGDKWRRVFRHDQPLFTAARAANDTLLVGGEAGTLLIGTKNGTQWKTVRTNVPDTLTRLVVDADGMAFLALGNKGSLLRLNIDGKILSRFRIDDEYLAAAVLDTKSKRAFVTTASGKLIRSLDGGHSWEVETLHDQTYLSTIALLPDQRLLVAGSRGVIAYSADNGVSWTFSPDTSAREEYNEIIVTNRGAAIALGNGGAIRRLSNDGKRWESVRPDMSFYVLDLVREPATGALLAAGGNGFFARSEDDGLTWRVTATGIPTHGQACCVLVERKTGAILMAGPPGTIVRSTDGGRTWERRLEINDLGNANFSRLVQNPETGTLLVLASPGRMYRSDDGGRRWQATDLSRAHVFYDVRHVAGSVFVAVGKDGAMFRSTNDGRHWAMIKLEWNNALEALHRDSRTGTLWAMGVRILLRSTDQGVSWSRVTLPAVATVRHMVELPEGALLVVGGQGAMFRSSNSGKHWDAIVSGVDVNLRQPVFNANTRELYIPGRDGVLLRSKDFGLHWENIETHTSEHLKQVLPIKNGALISGERIIRIQAQP
jgi:photosystem II stability/assembly factor-like uncharacterized protein